MVSDRFWHEFKPIPDAPAPAATTAERLVQMRALLDGFSASVSDAQAGRQELRLLAKPVFRYSQPKRGVTDGAIFVFARATNPEMMLVLEAQVGKDSQPNWMYSPARYTGRAGEMRCPAGRTWSHEATHGIRNPAEPFFQMNITPE